jgi:lytic murein transglycosylase
MLTFPRSARTILASALLGLFAAAPLSAAQCGNTAAGFDAWKRDFARIAAQAGIGERGLNALAGTSYATRTIAADRNQKSFGFTLEKFMEVRGASTIVAQGKNRKARDAAFYDALERQYGVPAGVIIAIHGMETAFGNFMGDSNVVSAIATLAYDCRRSEFFSGHALAALQLVDRGTISPQTVGAKHGELGHTQFLPGNVIKYAVDANGDGRIDMNNMTDALASTANFLRQKGWQPGQGYQEGEPNFRVIQEWNAAGVYQKAIAIMAKQIDG